MPLFRRKSDKNQVPEGLEPYYDQPSGWRLWVRRIIGLIAVALLIFLLVWAGMWVYRSVTDDGVDTGDTNISEDGGAPEDEAANGTNGEDSQDAQSEEDTEDSTEPADEPEDEAEQMPDTGDDSEDAPLPATGG